MKTLFILGCSRSGTTMLQQALNRHSQIVIPPETKFFCCLYRQRRRVQREHLQRLNADLGIALALPDRNIQTPQQGRVYFEHMARAYVRRLRRGDIEYFGEKTPEHTSQIASIREVFPDAKFVFLYRDGRDVAVSLTRVPWIRCNVYGGFGVWLYFYRILREAMRDPSLDSLYVKYENLAKEPERELQRIAGFLGVDYEVAMATGHGNSEGIPERERSWKGRALEPITAERIEIWRRELMSTVVQDLEWLGREELNSLGYSLATGGGRPASRLLRSRLAVELIKCAWQLPWPVLWNEVRRSLPQWRRSRVITDPSRTVAGEEFSERLPHEKSVARRSDMRVRCTRDSRPT